MTLDFWHRVHGDALHDIIIFLVERYVVQHGGHLMDVRAFKTRHLWPCEPDVVFWFEKKGIRYVYVVEVETHASTASVNRKTEQYMVSLKGVTDLIVLDLEEAGIAVNERITDLATFIKGEMPF